MVRTAKSLRERLANAGNIRVRLVILAPLVQALAYEEMENAYDLRTCEGDEPPRAVAEEQESKSTRVGRRATKRI